LISVNDHGSQRRVTSLETEIKAMKKHTRLHRLANGSKTVFATVITVREAFS